jgi:hypothetical protein
MKTKVNSTEKMVTISEKALLSLVAAKLKGRVLFPQKVENARRYMKDVQ